jgi:hypothetical protein
LPCQHQEETQDLANRRGVRIVPDQVADALTAGP